MNDLISRQAAIDTCMKYNGYGSVWACIKGEIKQLPSAQPERKKGKWIKKKGSLWTLATCSVCGELSVEGDKPFCPNCGAEMGGKS